MINNNPWSELEAAGLNRRAHSFTQEGGQLTGHLTFTTDDPTVDEVTAGRDLMGMITRRAFPMFGQGGVICKAVNFHWAITDQDVELYGAAVKCVISITYLTSSAYPGGHNG